MRGRKPKPLNLQILHGVPNRQTIANIRKGLHENSRQLKAEAPEKPTWLRQAASDEWDRIVPQLEKMGIISPVDHAVIESYCCSVGLLVELQPFVIGSDGLPNTRILNTLNRTKTLIKMLCAELGLSPQSRTRPFLSLRKENEEQNPYEQWKNSKKK